LEDGAGDRVLSIFTIMSRVRNALVALVVVAAALLVPEPASAAGGVCGLGQTGNYITVSFTFNPSCGGSGTGNNAANVVPGDMYPLYTNFDACVWGLYPSNWVFVGTSTYTEACGFGIHIRGPQARIAKVKTG
jgi:hypothetical protein